MARKRPRVPEVLRRVYGDRVRSLAEAILALVPKPSPSPEECRCRGKGCLGCGGSPFLLRPDDVPDYRRLLNRCFCVVSPNAPEFTELFYRRDWTQRLIVRNTMELLMDRSRPFGNVLCDGYDKRRRFSLNGELLCNSAWNLLLTRIGDTAMVYLLKFSSIFIPLPTSNHYQVTGPSLLRNPHFFNKSDITSLVSKDQQALKTGDCGSSGCKLKRKRGKFEEKQQGWFAIPDLHHGVPLPSHDSSVSVSSVAYGKPQRHVRPFKWNRCKKDSWVRVTEAGISKNYFHNNSCKDSSSAFLSGRYSINASLHSHLPVCANMLREMAQVSLLVAPKSLIVPEKGSPKDGIEDMKDDTNSAPAMHLRCSISPRSANCTPSDADCHSTSEFSPKSRKRGRLFSWKRHRKHKKANSLDDVLNCHASLLNDKEGSSRMLQKRSAINLNDRSSEEARTIICTGVDQVSELVNQHPAIIAEPNPLRKNVNTEAINHVNSEKLFHTNMTSTCFNCSMVQSPPKVSKRAEIGKKCMFYDSRSSTSIFPRDHILNKLKPNNSGAHALLKHIFDISDGNLNIDLASCFHSIPAIKSGCLYHSLLKILKTLIRNAHKCHHMEFLRRHCSAPNKGCSDNRAHKSEAAKRLSKKFAKKHVMQSSSENPFSKVSKSNTNLNNQEALHKKCAVECDLQCDHSGSYCRHDKVVSFLWAATRNIVPVDLLGDSSNWRPLRRNISKFVRLQRYEKFCLRQCIHGLQKSKFSFLTRIPDHHVCHCFNSDDSSTINDTRKYNNDWLVLKHKLLHRWIYWFFSYMIVPMLGANFYVTERESGRHEVFYYPKPVWSKLIGRTITALKEENYRPVDYKSFEQIIDSRPFGFSKVRFLPKGKGMRLLANLKAPSNALLHVKSFSGHGLAKTGNKARTYLNLKNCNTKAKHVHLKSVNAALSDMYAVLKRIRIECPQMLGASVFDYNDIYQMLYRFLSRLKNGSTSIPEMFIVVSDVSKAFDSIDQERLLDVMKDVIQKEEYHVRKYAQVICSKEIMRILYGRVCIDESKDNDMVNSLASIRSRSSRGVLIDQVVDRKIKLVEIQHLLRQHVKANILQLGQGFYLQKSGIVQGSLLSSLLCSFYYGHLERTIIFPFLGKICDLPTSGLKTSKEPNANGCTQADCWCNPLCFLKQHETCQEKSETFDSEKEDKDNMWKSNKWYNDDSERENGTRDDFFPNSRCLLLRLIDDFIFISTSKRQATCFFNRLCRGFREYNCYMNSEKFGLNFDVDNQPQAMPNRRYVGADGIPFLPWSGLLVNCHTLEVQADYTRYLGAHLRSTLTVHADSKQERLGEKLCNYMRPKCHPIFYDSNINSPTIVRLNAYQAFLLCAMKFHCYLCVITSNTCDIEPLHCLDIIQKSFRYMHRLIKKRMYGMDCGGLNIHPVFRLKKAETIWLGLSAYIRVLRKKQSRHAKLLSLLKAELHNLGRMDCDPSPLKYAVDDSHSSMFWKIRY